jgi:hypothetical protein
MTNRKAKRKATSVPPSNKPTTSDQNPQTDGGVMSTERNRLAGHMARKALPQNTCNYCKRLINTTTIAANNAVYCSKLCAAVGLIAEVHADDEICVDHLESLTEGLIGSVFYEGTFGIPVKVRLSDVLAFDDYKKAPEGFDFQVIPIEDKGTPDWVPSRSRGRRSVAHRRRA